MKNLEWSLKFDFECGKREIKKEGQGYPFLPCKPERDSSIRKEEREI